MRARLLWLCGWAACHVGVEGFASGQNISPCQSAPCQHGGTCVDTSGGSGHRRALSAAGFRCICASGFDAPRCKRPSRISGFVMTWGSDHACRASGERANSRSNYYLLHVSKGQPSACASRCKSIGKYCKGFEYNARTGRCALWHVTLSTAKAAAGYTCYAPRAKPKPKQPIKRIKPRCTKPPALRHRCTCSGGCRTCARCGHGARQLLRKAYNTTFRTIERSWWNVELKCRGCSMGRHGQLSTQCTRLMPRNLRAGSVSGGAGLTIVVHKFVSQLAAAASFAIAPAAGKNAAKLAKQRRRLARCIAHDHGNKDHGPARRATRLRGSAGSLRSRRKLHFGKISVKARFFPEHSGTSSAWGFIGLQDGRSGAITLTVHGRGGSASGVGGGAAGNGHTVQSSCYHHHHDHNKAFSNVAGANLSQSLHWYVIDWTPSTVVISVDGKVIRTVSGAASVPQKPLSVHLHALSRDWGENMRAGANVTMEVAEFRFEPAVQSHATTLLMDDSVVFVGRVHRAADGTVSFDMNGVQVQATVTGTTGLYASMSQVQKIEGNTFQVFLDGVLQPGSRFNTSSWVAGQVVKVPLFASGSLAAGTAHAVTIFKDTEPQFSGTRVAPNFVTFHGFSGDSGARLLAPVPRSSPQHRVEFLGDSITAGFDNQCDIPGSPKGFPWSESFAKSWATLICNTLGAECHYNAWSGFGMVANCCGGSTLASDVWTRTLATVGSSNASDPHGTTAENTWDFSKWTADAVVINLGTNDHLGKPNTPPTKKSVAYQLRYEALVVAAAKAYGKATRFFLACGPMSSDYCTEVDWVIRRANAAGIKAYLLDQRGFDDGAYGKVCAYGHPSSKDDAAIAKNGSAFIKNTMGW